MRSGDELERADNNNKGGKAEGKEKAEGGSITEKGNEADRNDIVGTL